MFLTGRHQATERERAFRFGVVDYLTKPIEPPVLVEKIALDPGHHRAKEKHCRSERMATSSQQLVEEVQRAARTGLLTVRNDAAQARILLRAGTIVDQTGDVPTPIRARFEEIDPRQEQIVTSEPDALLAGARPPTFDDIPPGLREVLIADNNPLFRTFLRSVLEARAFLVHETGDGDDALRMALRRPPLIALLDVQMRGLDGFEIRRRLRAHRATRSLPVLLLSGCMPTTSRKATPMQALRQAVSRGSSVREILTRMQLLMHRYAQAGSAGPGGTGMQGPIDVVGAPGLLQMCHLGRLTGVARGHARGPDGRMTFAAGALVTAASEERQGPRSGDPVPGLD